MQLRARVLSQKKNARSRAHRPYAQWVDAHRNAKATEACTRPVGHALGYVRREVGGDGPASDPDKRPALQRLYRL